MKLFKKNKTFGKSEDAKFQPELEKKKHDTPVLNSKILDVYVSQIP